VNNKVILTSVVIAGLLISGCDSSDDSSTSNATSESVTKEALGAKLFVDTNLSNQRTMSCSTCHDPENGFVDARFKNEGDSNTVHGALSVGDDGFSLGGRNAPTAAYAQFSPAFGKNDKDEYHGGQFHDGRSSTLADQAKGPFLDGAEMQMADKAAVIARVQENEVYISEFKTLYGEDIFDDVNTSYDAVADAIEAFESTSEFAPFDSKYDRFVACKEDNPSSQCYKDGNWTAQEQLGYDLFFSEKNTNCATCHALNSESEAEKEELFTNFGYENIGVPRNIAAMQARVDLGLQAPNTLDLGLGARMDINDTALHGAFKTPTLRNVAVTGPYMHNGVFNELKTVLEFYDHMGAGERPLNPETGEAWGATDVNSTVETEELEKTKELTDEKIDALEAFLNTLTDARYEHLLSK